MEKYKVIERSKDNGSTHSLLNEGMIPGIVYGKGTEPTKIAFENKALLKLMHTGGFYSTILDLDIEGKIESSTIKELVLTDSIEASNQVKNTKNIRHISIAPLMGEAIKRINSDSSVSALFD